MRPPTRSQEWAVSCANVESASETGTLQCYDRMILAKAGAALHEQHQLLADL